MYSMEQKRLCNRNWFKGGECIDYYRNNLMRKNKERSYYSLEFAYNFEYPNDSVYFAMNIPYTYTQLLKQLSHLEHQDLPQGVYLPLLTQHHKTQEHNLHSLK